MNTTVQRKATKVTPSPQPPAGLSREALLGLYEQMVLLRRFEQTVQTRYKNGEMPGFVHLYIGEEATAVGVCAHLNHADWITSTHRGHGHALAKGMNPDVLMAELYAKATGCCGGRGGSMHLYDPEVGLYGTNGLVGAGIPPAVGAGISAKTRGTDQVAVAFFGDGAVNHGAFHEGINFAAAQDAPVVFICENNLYATATPLSRATRNTDVASKAAAYGLPGVAVDGNDVIAVWGAMKTAVERARAGKGPTLIEARTYRTVGHHEGDPATGVYRTKEEVEGWKERDPIVRLRAQLVEEWGLASDAELDALDAKVESQVGAAVEFARASPDPDPATVEDHVFANPLNPPMLPATNGQTTTQGWLDAVRDGIAEEMRRDSHIIYLGEGTGERGGSFAHTKGLWAEFGGERMIDTPISELGFTGAAIGAAATGCRAVADLMFADFLFEAGSQIIHQAAKLRYTSNGRMSSPVVVRSGCGEIKTAGPHHSGTFHPIWAHIPGLVVVMPSTPADAKGLMKTALRGNDPVILLEHKSLFATKGEVPTGEYLVPFGQAKIAREGTDLTIVSGGLLLHRSLAAAEQLQVQSISCEVVDLRTIVPLDVDTIAHSLAKTGKLLVVDEGFAMCGVGGEIAAAMMEMAFDELDAPIGRLHNRAVTQPFSPALEQATVVTVEKIIAAAKAVVEGKPLVANRVKGHADGHAIHTLADNASSHIAPTPTPPHKVETLPAEVAPPSNGVVSNGAAPTPKPSAGGVPLIMPHGDLTISEGTIVQWLKKAGDSVAAEEPLVEIETDKAVTEIGAPVAGVLTEILEAAGTVVKMGQRLGTVTP